MHSRMLLCFALLSVSWSLNAMQQQFSQDAATRELQIRRILAERQRAADRNRIARAYEEMSAVRMAQFEMAFPYLANAITAGKTGVELREAIYPTPGIFGWSKERVIDDRAMRTADTCYLVHSAVRKGWLPSHRILGELTYYPSKCTASSSTRSSSE